MVITTGLIHVACGMVMDRSGTVKVWLILSPGPDTRHCQADSSPTAPTTPDNTRHPTTRQCHVVSHWDEACPVVKLSTRQNPTPDNDPTGTRQPDNTRQGPDTDSTCPYALRNGRRLHDPETSRCLETSTPRHLDTPSTPPSTPRHHQ